MGPAWATVPTDATVKVNSIDPPTAGAAETGATTLGAPSGKRHTPA